MDYYFHRHPLFRDSISGRIKIYLVLFVVSQVVRRARGRPSLAGFMLSVPRVWTFNLLIRCGASLQHQRHFYSICFVQQTHPFSLTVMGRWWTYEYHKNPWKSTFGGCITFRLLLCLLTCLFTVCPCWFGGVRGWGKCGKSCT